MGRRRNSTEAARGRKERALRYILKKKPCCYITIGEIISLILLTTIFVLCLILYLEERRIIEQFDAEDIILKRIGEYHTFAHCNFIEPNEFETKFCERRIDVESYAWRHYKLDPDEKDPTCMDLHEQIKCHENIPTIISKFQQRHYPSCAGLNKVQMPNAESSDKDDIKAPALNETELAEYLNKTVLAQELFLQCPRCKVRSRQFKIKVDEEDKCMVKLNTTKKGWPALAEDCDDLISIVHASHNCKEL